MRAAHIQPLFPSPLAFSEWSFPEVEVDCRSFISR
jgi:hypothetical protein